MWICIVLLCIGCGQKEPTYNGKSLSHWVNLLSKKDETTRKEAVDAVVSIGSPAVPSLKEALGSDNC